jgi:hypothetical protein
VWEPLVEFYHLLSSNSLHNLFTVGHIAENCSSEERLCYNCRQPGHESSACPSPRSVSAKQCYSCGGVGHIQAECPSLRVQSNGSQKCYVSGLLCHDFLLSADAMETELWSLWAHCAYLSQCWWVRNWVCNSCTSPRTCSQHVYTAPCQMLSLWWSKPHG